MNKPETPRQPYGFAGTKPPDVRRTVDSGGIAISVVEWGDPADPPLLFAHGGFDFAETLNGFAPLLVEAGWRVVSWDQRGHGHSAWAALYSWEADLRDAMNVLDSIDADQMPVIGHSKGGALTLQLVDAAPARFTHVVNLDGLPSRRSMPDVPDQVRTRMMSKELVAWLDYRRGVDSRIRRPGTIEELAERRGRMNTRLTQEWLRYLVTVGAREGEDGWRWRIDPTLRMGGFGPWRPEWSMQRLPSISVPFLAIIGLELEVLGWGTLPEDVVPFMPRNGVLEALEGVGHFVHIEQPRLIADLILSFIGSPDGVINTGAPTTGASS